jgi:hypothetical protein
MGPKHFMGVSPRPVAWPGSGRPMGEIPQERAGLFAFLPRLAPMKTKKAHCRWLM